MIIVNASADFINPPDYKTVLNTIETAGRVCYKSEDKQTEDSALTFVKNIIARGHESVLEHAVVTVRFICNRGVTHEIVRHRIASYSQESTRYCNYSKGRFDNQLTFIKPMFFDENSRAYKSWEYFCKRVEADYMEMLSWNYSPQEARDILPNALKTELVMTANMREWRHFFKLRTSKAAHPQMREVAIPLLKKFKQMYPVLFEDIQVEEI